MNTFVTQSKEFILTPEEEREMDVVSNAIIDFMLSNPCKYLKTSVKSNKLILDRKEEPR